MMHITVQDCINLQQKVYKYVKEHPSLRLFIAYNLLCEATEFCKSVDSVGSQKRANEFLKYFLGLIGEDFSEYEDVK